MKFERVVKHSFEVGGGLPGMAFEVVVFVAGPFDEILEFVVLDSRVEDFGTSHLTSSSRITGGGGGWRRPGVTSGGAGSRRWTLKTG